MKRVYISTFDREVGEMFLKRGWTISHAIEYCDLVCFTGGADVSPFLYGERPHKETHFSSARDNNEIQLWKKLPPQFPKVGICRGAQLGNVLCGGSLWQHVDNHQVRHPIKDLLGVAPVLNASKMMLATSSHHQMCKLTQEAKLYAVCNRSMRLESGDSGVYKQYGAQVNRNDWEDVEAFHYDNFNFLGVQFHPEWDGAPFCTEYFFKLLEHDFDFEDDGVVEDGPVGVSKVQEGEAVL